jgi:hypothetical protein
MNKVLTATAAAAALAFGGLAAAQTTTDPARTPAASGAPAYNADVRTESRTDTLGAGPNRVGVRTETTRVEERDMRVQRDRDLATERAARADRN